MTDGDSNTGAPTDVYLSLLADRNRRAVLLSLNERGDDAEPLPIEEILPGSMPESVEVALTHNHLPKLADHEVIRWNRDEGVVAPGPAFERVEPFIEGLESVRTKLPEDWRPNLGN
jgi:hypothetical protein